MAKELGSNIKYQLQAVFEAAFDEKSAKQVEKMYEKMSERVADSTREEFVQAFRSLGTAINDAFQKLNIPQINVDELIELPNAQMFSKLGEEFGVKFTEGFKGGISGGDISNTIQEEIKQLEQQREKLLMRKSKLPKKIEKYEFMFELNEVEEGQVSAFTQNDIKKMGGDVDEIALQLQEAFNKAEEAFNQTKKGTREYYDALVKTREAALALYKMNSYINKHPESVKDEYTKTDYDFANLNDITSDFFEISQKDFSTYIDDLFEDLMQIPTKLKDIENKLKDIRSDNLEIIDSNEVITGLKTLNEIEEAYKRILKAKRPTTEKKHISQAIDFDPLTSDKGIKTLYDQYVKLPDDSYWEIQYQALIKFVKAYEAFSNDNEKHSSMDSPQIIALYEQLKPLAANAENMLRNVLNMANHMPLVGMGGVEAETNTEPTQQLTNEIQNQVELETKAKIEAEARAEAEKEVAEAAEKERLEKEKSANISHSLTEEYNTASNSVKQLVNDLAMVKRAKNFKIEGFDKLNPSEEHKEMIFGAFNKYKRIAQEISDMPIIETEDDKQRLLELQKELIKFKSILINAFVANNNKEQYAERYGVGLEDAEAFKSSVFPANKDYLNAYNNVQNNLLSQLKAENKSLFDMIDVAEGNANPKSDDPKFDQKMQQIETFTAEWKELSDSIIRGEQKILETDNDESINSAAKKYLSDETTVETQAHQENTSAINAEIEAQEKLALIKKLSESQIGFDVYENYGQDVDYYDEQIIDLQLLLELQKEYLSLGGKQSDLTYPNDYIQQQIRGFETLRKNAKAVERLKLEVGSQFEEESFIDSPNSAEYNTIFTRLQNGVIDYNTALERMIALVKEAYAVHDDNEEKIQSYEELCDVIERLNSLRAKDQNTLTPAETSERDAILARLNATKGESSPDKAVSDLLQWGSMLKGSLPVSEDKMAQYLGIEIPQAANKAQQAVENLNNALKDTDNTNIDSGSRDNASAELKAIQGEAEELRHQIEAKDAQISSLENEKNKIEDRFNKVKEHSKGKKLVDKNAPDNAEELNFLRAQVEDANQRARIAEQDAENERNMRITTENALGDVIGEKWSEQKRAENAEAEVERLRQELAKMQTTPQTDTTENLGNVKISDTQITDENILKEKASLEALETQIKEVIKAVNSKTTAFVQEGKQVGQVVGKEVSALIKLNTQVGEVNKTILELLGNINTVVATANTSKSININVKTSDDSEKKTSSEQKKETSKKDNDNNKRNANDLKNLEKQYAQLGKMRAQFEKDGSNEQLAKWQNLANEIKQKRESLKLTKEEIALMRKASQSSYNAEKNIIEGKNIDAQKKAEQKAAKEQQKLEEKLWKDQVKSAQAETGINAASSMVKSGQNSVINAIGTIGATDEFTDKAKDLSQRVAELRILRDEIAEKGMAVDENDQKLLSTRINLVKQLKAEVDGYLAIHNKYSGDNSDEIGKFDASFNGLSREQQMQGLIDSIQANTEGRVIIKEIDNDLGEVHYEVKTGTNEFTSYSAAIDNVNNSFKRLPGVTKKTESMLDSIKRKFKEIFSYFSASSVIYRAFAELRKGIQYVKEIDSALTELKKVTDETEETYEKFLDTAAKTADKVGSTVKDVVSSTADWARLNI